jgi:hypothetical protein
MNALGEMLVRGVSMDEIAHRLRRDHGDVRDKVVEVVRACRGAALAVPRDFEEVNLSPMRAP